MEHKLQGQSNKSALLDCAEPYIAQMTEEDRQTLSDWMHDNRKPCPALYQEALAAILTLPEFKPPRMAEKAEQFEQARIQEIETMALAKEETPAKEPVKAAAIIAIILLASAAVGIAVYLIVKRKDEE